MAGSVTVQAAPLVTYAVAYVTDSGQNFWQVDVRAPQTIVDQILQSLPPDIANSAHFGGDQDGSRRVSYYPLTGDQVGQLSSAILNLNRKSAENRPYKPVGFYIVAGLGITGAILFVIGLVMYCSTKFRKRSDLIRPDKLL